MHIVRVAPLGTGWRVTSDVMDNDLIFAHGGDAEASARHLAMTLALSGRPAELMVVLRDGSLATSRLAPAGADCALDFSWQHTRSDRIAA